MLGSGQASTVSLKFSRLKIFAVFAGCTLTTKILSRENFSIILYWYTYACAIICGHGHLSSHKLLLLALSENRVLLVLGLGSNFNVVSSYYVSVAVLQVSRR